ncbi:Dihydroorotase [Anatilimnocola aggregata]|uniref:Dihydroorotase n=1 Tax=Anatilimnocola aggregata TaxID=2528021 RepID=A0A517YHD2_9BACT|nr:dihydroorotase [Anatilimnocola aggregata]QDU29622.1 Dihydroorotase [Anatilimnocola aggregata]
MRLLIQNGRVICPDQGLDRVMSVLVEDGRIAALDAEGRGDEQVIDATGKVVAPGLIDIHTQLREPGCEEDETIASGTAAALAGGYTTIACLPETDPPIDTAASVEFVRQKAARAANCNVFVIACVSKNKEGKELAELGTLSEAGAIAFSDGMASIQSSELLRRALEYSLMFGKPILHHPESIELSRGGVMHEGKTSLVLGLAGMPAEAEDVMTSRDIRLTEATHGRLHLLNISSAVSIELVRRTKLRGIHLTAGVCAINFTLTDEELRSFDADFKLNPPLRSREHVEACIAGLKFGTIDIISAGHAPRASEKKMQELDLAPFGMSSLETTLPLVITKLIEPGHLDWISALAKLTVNPAKLLGLNKGTLRVGADADLTIIDPATRWTVDPSKFKSKSCNTPLAGYAMIGRATQTIVGGEVKYERIAD